MEIKIANSNSNSNTNTSNSNISVQHIPSMYLQSQQSRKTQKTPNSPLIKSPFIKIKIEAKNLEKSLINSQSIHYFTGVASNNNEKYSVSLEPFANIILNKQSILTKPIFHNSPKWLDEYELEVNNNKTDRIVIEFFSKSITLGNSMPSNNLKDLKDPQPLFLGFQILPIKFLEKFEKVGETSSIWLRLINKRQDEYFVTDSRHVLNIDNHDPGNYKVDDSVILREKDIGVPLLKISYEYMDFYHLWLINCTVHTIIQREDPHDQSKHYYKYRLFIKRNDDLEWYKDATFGEIEHFRNYLIRYIKEVKDIPFPTKSILAYLPVIGSFYSDENNDVLVEKKFLLDNFFEGICSNMQVYKLDEFNKFFEEEI